MSELPKFKEGFIFDATNTNGKTFTVTINRDKLCLFKIGDVEDYSKYEDYCLWWCSIEGHQCDDYVYAEDMLVKQYKTINFVEYFSTENFSGDLIEWNGGIYFAISKGSSLNAQVGLTRHPVENPNVYDIYLDITWDLTTPDVYYNDTNIKFDSGYKLTIQNPVYNIKWNCDKSDNILNSLKYYQFCLYNVEGDCVVDTGKIYTDIPSDFICDSLDDKSTYVLVGCCVLQNGTRLDLPDLTIRTAYNTNRIYAKLTIELDRYKAENRVCTEIVNIIGETTNGDVDFIDGEKVKLKQVDNSIIFADNYNLLENNFLVRVWIEGATIDSGEKVVIFKLYNIDKSDYIEVSYQGNYFYATKYSCGLTSQYISNLFNREIIRLGGTYFSMLYKDGRIDMYATSFKTS